MDGCAACQKCKPIHQLLHGLLTPNEILNAVWDIISVDMIVELPHSKSFNAILVVDRPLKMVKIMPCAANLTVEGLAHLFRDNVWHSFGLLQCIISDRGSIFLANFTRALNNLLGISQNASTAFQPQTDGQTEHANQEIEQCIRLFVNILK